MGNTTILVAGTRAARLAHRAEFVKEHQPMLFEAPRYFLRADWYHRKLRELRAKQNKRKRNLRKALYLKLSYEYKQYQANRHNAFLPEDI